MDMFSLTIGLIIGAAVGGTIGLFTVALLSAGKYGDNSDSYIKKENYNESK